MPFVPLPAKPTQGRPWLDVGDSWYDNVAQLIADVPALKTDVAATAVTLQGLQTSKAPLANPTFTGVVSGVTKSMVGLGNVDNTADSAKAFSAAQITTGVLPAGRLPSAVAAIRRRTPTNEQAPTATNWEPRPVGYGRVLNIGAAPPPADADPADLHVTLAAVTTAGTTFTGLADGAAWPQPWAVAKMPTGGAAVVASERGRLSTGTTTGNYSSADMVSVRHSTTAANVELLFTFRKVTADAHPRAVLRCDNATLDPANGVAVILAGTGSSGTVQVSGVTNWSYVTIGSAVVKNWAVGTDYRVRVRLSGSTVQVRAWAAASTEPTTWDINGSTTVTAAGYVGLTCGTGSAAASQTVHYDDITVSAL